MATVTPNFNWPVPTSTDLVKDGATAIEALGDSIDASLLDLKGGTSGQVLAKNSNTDMDFIWVTDAAGDITGVTAGTGISGGGTSGTVTVTNSMATAIDAKGDLVAGTAADTFARLAVGANGTVLTADSAEATGLKWTTPSGGKIVQVVYGITTTNATSSSTTYADTNLTATITPTSASNYILAFVTQNGIVKFANNSQNGVYIKLMRGATDLAEFSYNANYNGIGQVNVGNTGAIVYKDSPASTSALIYKTQFRNNAAAAVVGVQDSSAPSTITLMEVAP